MNTTQINHEKISPTAKLVAFWRQFSDIPYAKDVATLIDVQTTWETLFNDIESDKNNTLLSTVLELRYKSIHYYLKKNDFKQVLEFASGISLRGLAMTRDPSLTYVETDLPGISREKDQLLDIIKNKYSIKNNHNLFFHTTNVFHYNEITPILEHFSDKYPLAIVHEGLFQYLTRDEKARAAKNIRTVLEKFDGQWISPDMDTKEKMHAHVFDKVRFQKFIDAIEKNTGCNFVENAFNDDDDIYNFFDELGFTIRWIPQFQEGIELSSLNNSSFSPDSLDSLKSLRLWIMTLKK